MTPEDEKEVARLMREARSKSRGYADFFSWGTDRDIEEWGVANTLRESLKIDGEQLFTSLKSRKRPNDPPDCEAIDESGNRIAIEVTELVDSNAIKAFKDGVWDSYEFADWNKDKFLDEIEKRLSRKDLRHPYLKEPPYKGGYIVVIFTDEPMLNRLTVESYLRGHKFKKPYYLTKAFLLVSYDPSVKKNPQYELQFSD